MTSFHAVKKNLQREGRMRTWWTLSSRITRTFMSRCVYSCKPPGLRLKISPHSSTITTFLFIYLFYWKTGSCYIISSPTNPSSKSSIWFCANFFVLFCFFKVSSHVVLDKVLWNARHVTYTDLSYRFTPTSHSWRCRETCLPSIMSTVSKSQFKPQPEIPAASQHGAFLGFDL